MKPGDWIGYSADTAEDDILRLAAAKLDVPEKHIEIRWTKGAVLARARQEDG
jgi:hypothetical protein